MRVTVPFPTTETFTANWLIAKVAVTDLLATIVSVSGSSLPAAVSCPLSPIKMFLPVPP